MIKFSKKVLMVISILSVVNIVQTGYASPISGKNITINLMKMESPAEDMLDAIDRKNIKNLHSLYDELSVYVNKVNRLKGNDNTQSKNIALLNSWFDQISLEIKEADNMAAMANAINQFSGQLIISIHFENENREDIAWMDYLGRELLLLNKYPSEIINHDALILMRKIALQTTWNRIKTIALHKKGGISLIRKVNPTIQSILNESNANTLVSLSKKELNLVDNIETFFHVDLEE